MPQGFWVKAASNQAYKPITGFWVKVSPTSWVSVSDAWVKVDANQSFQPFYSAGTSPVAPLEILNTTDSSDRLRLQGVNKRWTPVPVTLQYKFVYVDPTTNSEQDITSYTTTTNPSSGNTTTLPSATTYVTIANGLTDPYWYPGQDNVYKFRVRGSTASGLFFTSEAEYHMLVPKAPTLTITNKTTTSLTLNITAATDDDYLATNRYIVYAYDGTAYRYAGSAGGITGLGGYSATSNPRTVNIGGLVLGKTYTFYVIPTTGFSGTTDSNISGYQGLEASIDTTSTGPQPPTSFTATTNLSDKVRLTWSGASGDISSFGIYWSSGSGGPGDQDGDLNDETVNPDFTANVDNSSVFSTSGYYDDIGISAGTTRYYWIRSQGPSGNGLWTPVNGGVPGTRVDTKPVNSVLPSITGTIKEGQTVTLNAGTWSNSPTNYKYEVGYETYDPLLGELIFNTVQTYNSSSTTQSYTIPFTWKSSYGTNTQIRLLVTASNASGSNFEYSPSYSVTAGVSAYTFSFGNTLYVSTNGYIAFDSGYGNDAVTSTLGRVLAVIPRDLQQDGNIYYWSNTSEFRIKWAGYNYNQPSQPQVYEVTFYNNQQYADVYIENSASQGNTTGAYFNDGVAVTNYSSALTTGQGRRVYFNTTAPTSVSYTPKSTGVMLQASLTSGSTDQGYTTITTSTNQQASVPVNSTAPSVTPSSGTAGSQQFSVSNDGSWTNNPTGYLYQWKYNEGGAFGYLAISGATSSTYTPPSNYVTLYGSSLRCYVTAVNGAGSSLEAGSNVVTVNAPVVATKLSTPTNVVASDNRSDGIQVSWTNVANAATYGVWWGGAPDYNANPDFGGPNNNGGKTITGSPFLDDGVSTGTTRNYYVQAFPSTSSTTYLKSDWSAGDSGTRVAAVTYYTVTWNANGGSVSPSSFTQSSGNLSTTAPTPTRSGYTFNGWYNSSSGGSLIVNAGSSYTPTSNITLYAQWTVVSTNVGNNKPQGAPSITYDSANSTSTNWAYDVTIVKSTVGNPEPSYYLQWFGSGNTSNYVTQTGPYTSSGLGGSFTVQNVLVPKTYTVYGCQAWATNGISGQDISNTGMSNIA